MIVFSIQFGPSKRHWIYLHLKYCRNAILLSITTLYHWSYRYAHLQIQDTPHIVTHSIERQSGDTSFDRSTLRNTPLPVSSLISSTYTQWSKQLLRILGPKLLNETINSLKSLIKTAGSAVSKPLVSFSCGASREILIKFWSRRRNFENVTLGARWRKHLWVVMAILFGCWSFLKKEASW